MRVFIEDSHPPIAESELSIIEQRHGFKLPADFRRFLLQHNGGRPRIPPKDSWQHAYFKVQFPRREDEVAVKSFYTVDTSGKKYAAFGDKTIRLFRPKTPLDFIPIGNDNYGNPICISLAAETYGKVYFWLTDGDAAGGPPGSDPRIGFISNSFTEFLEKLHPLGDAATAAEGA